MKHYLFPFYLILFAVLLFMTGCDDSLTGDEIDSREIPKANVSFSKHIQPVLELKCSSSGCHNNETRAGGIALTSWAQTTADPNIIFPGEPENSKLVWAIEARAGVPPMPPVGFPPLTFEQIRGIKTWISEGANNN